MYFKKFAALAAALVVALVSTTAQATYFTSNGTVELTSTQTPGGPLNTVISLSGGSNNGEIYTNQISGTVSSAGGVIHTVSAQYIDSARTPLQTDIEFSPHGANNILVAVSAVSGTLVSDGTVLFDTGKVFLIETNEATFDAQDPSSWIIGSTLVATYSLATPDTILPGSLAGIFPSGNIVPQPPSVINLSSIAAIPGAPQGQFLFLEDPANSFIHDVVPPQTGPFGGLPVNEGLLTQINQIVDPNSTGKTVNGNVLDAADLAVLNNVAGAAGLANTGGANTAFATGFNNTGVVDSNFYAAPGGLATKTGTGDFFAALASTSFLVVQAVPEPSTFVLAGMGFVALAGVAARRRNKKSA
jgi:hypothetical protein